MIFRPPPGWLLLEGNPGFHPSGHLVAEFSCSRWKFSTSVVLEFPWSQLVSVSCCICHKGSFCLCCSCPHVLADLHVWRANVILSSLNFPLSIFFPLGGSAVALLRSGDSDEEEVYETFCDVLWFWPRLEEVLRSTGIQVEFPALSWEEQGYRSAASENVKHIKYSLACFHAFEF